MNEHAKLIYQAALDGKTVQMMSGRWIDTSPFVGERIDLMPHKSPERWRIKPKNETRYFRVYLDSEDLGPYVFQGDLEEVPEFEKEPYFGGWLTVWISYEVEVDQ